MKKVFSFLTVFLVIFLLLNMINSCKKDLPDEIITANISNITYTSADCGGTITSDGGAKVTERGVCWSTNQNPTISDNKTIDGNGEGSFASNLTNLTPLTTYYVRSYATNSKGTSYGNEISFSTMFGIVFNPNLTYGTMTDIDGNLYKTIQIGTQTWMAENLKVTRYNNGDPISNVKDNLQWSNLTKGAYCSYDNDVNHVSIYGYLYNWDAVNTGKLAPFGWHVPTDIEWNTLSTYLMDDNVSGAKLKEIGIYHWLSPNFGATNETGFTAIPGGARLPNGMFNDINTQSVWWSSTINGGAWVRYCINIGSSFNRDNASIICGFSVRCIKD